MDIQNDALENASSLIEDSLNPHKVPLSHSFTLFFSFFFFLFFCWHFLSSMESKTLCQFFCYFWDVTLLILDDEAYEGIHFQY